MAVQFDGGRVRFDVITSTFVWAFLCCSLQCPDCSMHLQWCLAEVQFAWSNTSVTLGGSFILWHSVNSWTSRRASIIYCSTWKTGYCCFLQLQFQRIAGWYICKSILLICNYPPSAINQLCHLQASALAGILLLCHEMAGWHPLNMSWQHTLVKLAPGNILFVCTLQAL